MAFKLHNVNQQALLSSKSKDMVDYDILLYFIIIFLLKNDNGVIAREVRAFYDKIYYGCYLWVISFM